MVLQSTVGHARVLRAQRKVQAEELGEALAWAFERRAQPKLDHNAPQHYHVLHSLARAHFAAWQPPDGTVGWDADLARAVAAAEAESEAVRTALLNWDVLFDPAYVEPWPFDPYGYHDAQNEHRWARTPVPLPSMLLSWLQHMLGIVEQEPHDKRPSMAKVERAPAQPRELDVEEQEALDAADAEEQVHLHLHVYSPVMLTPHLTYVLP